MIGGAIVLFEELIDAFKTIGVDFILIDSNKKNYSSTWHALISITTRIIINSNSKKIFFFNSSNDYLFISLLLPFLTFKKTILRKFGNEFIDSHLGNRGLFQKILVWFVTKQYDFIFLEKLGLLLQHRRENHDFGFVR